jgi:hypothetical protein
MVAWIAQTCLAFVVLGIGVSVWLGRQAFLFRRVRLEKTPEALANRAREIFSKAGYSGPFADSAFGLSPNGSCLQYVREHDRAASRWDRLPASAIQFWNRQSPRLLKRRFFFAYWLTAGVTSYDPPVAISGESGIGLIGLALVLSLAVYAFHTSLGGRL